METRERSLLGTVNLSGHRENGGKTDESRQIVYTFSTVIYTFGMFTGAKEMTEFPEGNIQSLKQIPRGER